METNFSAEEVFSRLGIKYSRKGNKLVSLCPFHNEKTPSFNFDTDKNLGYCFGCGKGVNLWSLVKELTGKKLTDYLGIKNYSKSTLAYSNSLKQYQKKEVEKKEIEVNEEIEIVGIKEDPFNNEESKKYCISRNITKSDVKKYNIFYLSDGYIGLTRYTKRLVIPIYDKKGIPLAYEGRDVTRKQEKKCIYNYKSKIGSTIFDYNNLDYSKRVTWVEGILDKLQTEKALPNEQVSSYFGIQLTNNQKEIVNRFVESILLLDKDSGGERGIENIAEFIERDFSVCMLDYGDPNENTYESIVKAHNSRIPSAKYFMDKFGLLQKEETEDDFFNCLQTYQ